MILLRAIGIWLCILASAVGNGIFRELVLSKHLASHLVLPLSGVILSALVAIISFLSMSLMKGKRAVTYIGIGAFWVILTLIFEYAFGVSRGKSLVEITKVFHVLEGNLFTLVLLTILVSPVIAAMLRGYVVSDTH